MLYRKHIYQLSYAGLRMYVCNVCKQHYLLTTPATVIQLYIMLTTALYSITLSTPMSFYPTNYLSIYLFY